MNQPESHMKPEIKAQWIAALRSGKYKQTKGFLRTGAEEEKFGYCCLGVLCDLYTQSPECDGYGWKETLTVPSKYGDVARSQFGHPDGREDGVPPVKVLAWAGLDIYNPRVEIPNVVDKPITCGVWNGRTSASMYVSSLASFNDQGATFEEIANLIEERF